MSIHLRYKRLIIRHKQQCRHQYHLKMPYAKKHRKNPSKNPIVQRIFWICYWKSSSYTPSLEAFWALLKPSWAILVTDLGASGP